MESTAEGKSITEVKNQTGIFQGEAQSTLLFVIAMIPLNHILKKFTGGYKLSKSKEKINHLMYMDDIKVFTKNEKELKTLIQAVRIYRQDIRMEFGIENCAILRIKNGKRRMTEGKDQLNKEKIRMLGEKETYKDLRI